MDMDSVTQKEIKQFIMNPNAELAWPVSWVGIYDKSVTPAHLRVGTEGLTMYVSGKVLKALEAERIGVIASRSKHNLKQPFVPW